MSNFATRCRRPISARSYVVNCARRPGEPKGEPSSPRPRHRCAEGRCNAHHRTAGKPRLFRLPRSPARLRARLAEKTRVVSFGAAIGSVAQATEAEQHHSPGRGLRHGGGAEIATDICSERSERAQEDARTRGDVGEAQGRGTVESADKARRNNIRAERFALAWRDIGNSYRQRTT